MALIVEDGSQVAGAESYISEADASTYHAARGNDLWATGMTTAEREEALRRATDYMVQAYRGLWKGFRVSSSQALDWPRANVPIEDGPYNNLVANNVVPQEVKNACALLAFSAAAGDLAPNLEQAVVSETVELISTTYNTASPQHVRYRAVDMMLRMYLKSSGVMTKLERA